MSPGRGSLLAGFLFMFVAPFAVADSAFPMTLTLQRAFPAGGGEELEAARARDMARHRRMLQNVVDFPVGGSGDPFSVGLYYTTVKLGNPPVDYHVQIDTGSDILWVTCNPCSGCPSSSGLSSITLRLYDPQKSSASSIISCSDSRCVSAIETAEARCESQNCGYTFQYGDGSGTTGYYVSDTLSFNTVVANDATSNSSATITFGCSSTVSGDLTKSDRAVDGILGFGQNHLSVISQLASQNLAPKAFSHCLRGSQSGGGILVLGKVVDPSIVYTPLVPSMPHYNLYLESISVNGQTLSIDSSVFATASTSGTIIDSGTTLAYIAEQAYDVFITAISSYALGKLESFNSKGANQCFLVVGSVEDAFPPVSLNFKGASMVLKPQDYLLDQGSVSGATVWCIGWQKMQGSMTILGDIVLKDKIFVYDLEGQQVGWTNYDCTRAVNVSSSSGKSAFVQDNSGQTSASGSTRRLSFDNLIFYTILIGFLHAFLGSNFLYSCTKSILY
ncbi:aspartic proteinase 36-like [Nymphaea colorata]|nr:aspartic proteinase 36-like [Nymphaea colorata]